MCIEPPKPIEVPVDFPNNSAIIRLGSTPIPIGITWFLYAVIILSFSGSITCKAPASTAS